MCDFSLHHVKSRPAKVGDKLRTVNFNTGTRGFAAPEDSTLLGKVLPGTSAGRRARAARSGVCKTLLHSFPPLISNG